MEIANYFKGCVNYKLSPENDCFVTNLDRDLHLFIIWAGARHDEQLIISELSESFSILAQCKFEWSPEFYKNNIKRFYKFFDNERIINNINLKVRDGKFTCVVVEDKSPIYKYRQNVSGPIQLVNDKALSLKRLARNRVGDNVIHSSSSPEEFYEQAVLLFTEAELKEIIKGQWVNSEKEFKRNLIGCDGWKDFKELFFVLRNTADYLILRNYEFLLDEGGADINDIDLLCQNDVDVIAGANLQDKGTQYSGNVKVADRDIVLDLHTQSDRYFDPNWVREMLDNKINNNGLFVPEINDYFFALIYHYSLKKKIFKSKYKNDLINISRKFDFDFFDIDTFESNKSLANVVSGYLLANHYIYEKPTNRVTYQNYSVIQYLDPKVTLMSDSLLFKLYRSLAPRFIKRLIPTFIKNLIKRAL